MAHIRMKLYSNCLRRYTNVTILIPTPTESDYPPEQLDTFDEPKFFQEQPSYRVLYLLHGTHGDDTDWSYYSNVERDIIGSNLMVVCPDGGNSFWTDMEDGPLQETFLTQELREYINRLFPTLPERENTFLAGLSMGGFATLNIAMKYPEIYGKVASFSAGIIPDDLDAITTRTYPWRLFLSDDKKVEGSKVDGIMSMKTALRQKLTLPEIYLTIGTDDYLYENVQRTRNVFDEHHVSYEYYECEGEHNFEFWSSQIGSVIKWMLNE